LTKGVWGANPQRTDRVIAGPGQLIFQRMPGRQQLPRLGVAVISATFLSAIRRKNLSRLINL
ncbi:hypothetical protein HZD82_24555, partial [Pantoea agglomerans]|nr:hypothetical protein [Pantoea agglomerans]